MAGKEPIKPRLLSVKEASIYLSRSIPALRELIWKGEFPVIRTGRRIHIDTLDLEKWIQAHKVRYTY
jgi:excisionase family DNA binding protein